MNKRISVFGVPMDLGQGRRGVDMGPSAVRYAGLDDHLRRLGYAVTDRGNVPVPILEEEADADGESGTRFLRSVASANARLADRVEQAMRAGEIAVVLGGDHSIAAGSAAGARRLGRMGLLWVDAHGDYNTPETSPSGNLHGMPLAALVGREPRGMAPIESTGPVSCEEVALVGVRSLDARERQRMLDHKIQVHTMRDLDQHGIAATARSVLEHFTRLGLERIHVSFDLDVLDPVVAPGVGTPVPGGLTYREAHLLAELLCDDGRVASLDLVEINPILDVRNATAQMAVEIAASLLGQTIL